MNPESAKSIWLGEFFGTAFLLAIAAGSGIMAEQLSHGNAAIALLANSLATGAGLYVLIQCLAPVSGAHLNPVVTLMERLQGALNTRALIRYWSAQFSGALAGVWITHAMFDLPWLQIASKNRTGANLGFSEAVATFGLLMVIRLSKGASPERAPLTIAAFITSAYWFTSSTSFANPAVTVARSFTDTFCGIAPSDTLGFIAGQLAGSGLAFWCIGRTKPIITGK